MNYEVRGLLLGEVALHVNATVAMDGTGDFLNLTAAIIAAPNDSPGRHTIYVKSGTYREYVVISKKNLMVFGDGTDSTIITGNRSVFDGLHTFETATFAVTGQGFIGFNMAFENTAGREKEQAVAFRSKSDFSVLYKCKFDAFQDTLYAHKGRQFYRDCEIKGTIDFIFGDASAVFQNCLILARQGVPNAKNAITAQGRNESNSPTGFTIQLCNISADSDLSSAINPTLTYLGRPWKSYSRTVIMQSYISGVIQQEGWLEWNKSFALDTLYYGEYLNHGPGAEVAGRVAWKGFHVINDSAIAKNFTVANLIKGDNWLPSTGVKYTPGLDE